MPTDTKFLRTFSCFRDLSDDQLEAIAKFSDAICYMPDHILFREGEPGKNIYFLVKGKVEVLYNISEDGEARVDTITGEEIAGCSVLIEPYTYTATERSLTEIEVLVVEASALRELMQKDCRFGMLMQQRIIKVLMDRILNLRLGVHHPIHS